MFPANGVTIARTFCACGAASTSFQACCKADGAGVPAPAGIAHAWIAAVSEAAMACRLTQPYRENGRTDYRGTERMHGSYGTAFIGYRSAEHRRTGSGTMAIVFGLPWS